MTLTTELEAFAAANGLQYGSHVGPVTYPGMIFRLGVDPTVPHHLFRLGDNYLDVGNYTYTLRVLKNSITYQYGFVALKLDRMMPHMVLDAKRNDSLGATTLPVGFHRRQVLSLEGGFDRHFTLYCPKGFEQDALYVFTPDMMALLIDEADLVDVEVIDDWMFLYYFGGFDLSETATMTRLFGIIDTVGAKMRAITDSYADPRMQAADAPRQSVNQVAAGGVRLKRAMTGAQKLAVIVIVLTVTVPFAAAILHAILTR